MTTCETCRQWHVLTASASLRVVDPTIGHCHAGPPSADFKWPKTRCSHTCSVHAPRGALAKPPEPAPLAPAEFFGLDSVKKTKRKAAP